MTYEDHRPRVAAERRARMRARLLQAALDLAATQGPADVSVDDVIVHAGVSRGTFYKYFDGPTSLIQELALEVGNSIIAALQPLVEPLTDPARCVSVGVRASLRLAKAHPIIGAFVTRAGWPVIREQDQLLYRVVAPHIESGIRLGRFARMHRDVALNLVAGTTIGGMRSMALSRVARDYPEQAATALLRALGIPDNEAMEIARSPFAGPIIPPMTAAGILIHGPRETVAAERPGGKGATQRRTTSRPRYTPRKQARATGGAA